MPMSPPYSKNSASEANITVAYPQSIGTFKDNNINWNKIIRIGIKYETHNLNMLMVKNADADTISLKFYWTSLSAPRQSRVEPLRV